MRTMIECLLLGLLLGLLLQPALGVAEHGNRSLFDNRDAIERQNADQERHQQEMFRYQERSRDWYKSPC